MKVRGIVVSLKGDLKFQKANEMVSGVLCFLSAQYI